MKFPVADGVKSPLAFTPVPLHVPPAGLNPVSCVAPALLHKVISLPAFTVGMELTVTTNASVAEQLAASTTNTL